MRLYVCPSLLFGSLPEACGELIAALSDGHEHGAQSTPQCWREVGSLELRVHSSECLLLCSALLCSAAVQPVPLGCGEPGGRTLQSCVVLHCMQPAGQSVPCASLSTTGQAKHDDQTVYHRQQDRRQVKRGITRSCAIMQPQALSLLLHCDCSCSCNSF